MEMIGPLTKQEWSAARLSYSYPPARLTEQPNGRLVVRGRAVDVDTSLIEARDFLGLDLYHYGLLTSEDKSDRLHGLLSVVYWGFYGSAVEERRVTSNRAFVRAQWFVKGNIRFSPTDLDEVDGYLCAAIGSARQGRLSLALRDLMSIRFLKMAFATKVIAFIAPEAAGVYDRRISDKLLVLSKSIPELADAYTKVSGPYSPTKAAAYERWCEYCAGTAAKLARETECSWRAIDVERALFATV